MDLKEEMTEINKMNELFDEMNDSIHDPHNQEIIKKCMAYAFENKNAMGNNKQKKIDYRMLVFQCLGLVKLKKTTLRSLSQYLLEGKILTRCEAYDKMWKQQKEQDEYIENPMEMVDGVIQCGACKKWRIMVVQKQTRSADEGYTMFYTCVSCMHKWIGS